MRPRGGRDEIGRDRARSGEGAHLEEAEPPEAEPEQDGHKKAPPEAGHSLANANAKATTAAVAAAVAAVAAAAAAQTLGVPDPAVAAKAWQLTWKSLPLPLLPMPSSCLLGLLLAGLLPLQQAAEL